MTRLISKARQWAKAIECDVHAGGSAALGSQAGPWYAEGDCVACRRLCPSPIDLIPDFIPVLGYLDDLVLVPLGILLAVAADPAKGDEEHRPRSPPSGF